MDGRDLLPGIEQGGPLLEIAQAVQANRLSRLGKRSAARRWSWFSRQLSLLYQVGKLSS